MVRNGTSRMKPVAARLGRLHHCTNIIPVGACVVLLIGSYSTQLKDVPEARVRIISSTKHYRFLTRCIGTRANLVLEDFFTKECQENLKKQKQRQVKRYTTWLLMRPRHQDLRPTGPSHDTAKHLDAQIEVNFIYTVVKRIDSNFLANLHHR